ncbi:hypothetical protein CPB83DRAFT_907526 [Crepidotus variabilis]|uniref:Zn(2)-C6 fungal-type domain-containing protein n=1 Tax=Crepidotus variabilis TaxID=179855 RepID=A0A9P6EDN5_9AGAR|nr:hypothetical protein CPB83DRAFT_907526 [Crepidotus variabilis]
MISPEEFQPLQLKGEIMDLEFTIDTDHRKRRRNRTTQSCLNCHTSKRKCDRKRPCQRCIQLGLTGLCVYEIDDPALRDDPTLDESTRLRNRIAELESLVRELRGKPHPRWAESGFRDGDPNEKWHSRATKCIPLQKRTSLPQSPTNGQPTDVDPRNGQATTPGGRGMQNLLIKTEPATDANSHLYRFSPSPAPSMRYHSFQQGDLRGSEAHSQSSFDADPRSAYATGANGSGYHSTNPTNGHYSSGTTSNGAVAAAPSNYSDGGSNGAYPLNGSDDGNHSTYGEYHRHTSTCPCRSNPALGMTYMTLSQALQTSLNTLRQYSHHPSNAQCSLLRRINDLNTALHSGLDNSPRVSTTTSYDSGQTSSDGEIMTPLSASSGPTSFHNGSPAVSPQEWNHLASAGYNPYFPGTDHHGVYNVSHVIT